MPISLADVILLYLCMGGWRCACAGWFSLSDFLFYFLLLPTRLALDSTFHLHFHLSIISVLFFSTKLSYVRCHVSSVRCLVSGTCHVSGISCIFFFTNLLSYLWTRRYGCSRQCSRPVWAWCSMRIGRYPIINGLILHTFKLNILFLEKFTVIHFD